MGAVYGSGNKRHRLIREEAYQGHAGRVSSQEADHLQSGRAETATDADGALRSSCRALLHQRRARSEAIAAGDEGVGHSARWSVETSLGL